MKQPQPEATTVQALVVWERLFSDQSVRYAELVEMEKKPVPETSGIVLIAERSSAYEWSGMDAFDEIRP